MPEVLENIIGRLPEKLVFFCAALAYLVPYSINKINSKLHEHGDPPWKKEEDKEG